MIGKSRFEPSLAHFLGVYGRFHTDPGTWFQTGTDVEMVMLNQRSLLMLIDVMSRAGPGKSDSVKPMTPIGRAV